VYSRIMIRLDFNDTFFRRFAFYLFSQRRTSEQGPTYKSNAGRIPEISSGNSPFAQGDWYRIDLTDVNGVTCEGMYK